MKLSKPYDSIVFDWDGTLAYGNNLIPSSKSLLQHCMKSSNVFILSNSSSRSREDILKILNKNNISFNINNIITGNEIVKHYLKTNKINKMYVFGSKLLGDNLSIHSDDEWEVIVITYAKEIDPQELQKLLINFNASKRIIALDSSLYVPKDSKLVPGTYWIVKTFEELFNTKVTTIGKPSLFPKRLLVNAGCEGKVLFVGDSSADEQFAKKAGYDYMHI